MKKKNRTMTTDERVGFLESQLKEKQEHVIRLLEHNKEQAKQIILKDKLNFELTREIENGKAINRANRSDIQKTVKEYRRAVEHVCQRIFVDIYETDLVAAITFAGVVVSYCDFVFERNGGESDDKF